MFPLYVRGLHCSGIKHEVCVWVVDAVEVGAAEGRKSRVEAACGKRVSMITWFRQASGTGRHTLLPARAQIANSRQ